MLVAGCDFGASAKAGEQARKTIFIEARRVGDRKYLCDLTGRNRRLVQGAGPKTDWKSRRSGWTIPDLFHSLASDTELAVIAFDFPFSIPQALLESREFAALVGQPQFTSRSRLADFLERIIPLTFSTERASGQIEGLKTVRPWQTTEFWIKRETDIVANSQPPLKHAYQAVFNMTMLGIPLLKQLAAHGLENALVPQQIVDGRRICIEAYPAIAANRFGVTGSYKRSPTECVQRAVQWLKGRQIQLQVDKSVVAFCATYQTAANDFDGADAFLCLCTAIACREQAAEMLVGTASEHQLRNEGAIVVPSAD